MASQRGRASSDKSQQSAPQRPPLQSRTISAPAGKPHKHVPTGADGGHNKAGNAVIEEEDVTSSSVGSHAMTGGRSELWRITIAIVGGDNAGKTTFITSALGLKSPPSSRSTVKKMSLDGCIHSVCLLELSSEEVAVDDAGKIRFGADSTPSIDGVLVLHDPTQPATFDKITRLLESLTASPLPFVVAASKADALNPAAEDPVARDYEVQTAAPESPRSLKHCISRILRSVVGNRKEKVDSIVYEESARAAPASSSVTHSHHVRASSQNPTTLISPATAPEPNVDGHGESRSTDQVHPSTSSFLDMEDDQDEANGFFTPETPSSPRSQTKSSASTANEAGFTLDELVDRLVSKPNTEPGSRSDSKFQTIFLCLYRKFASPASLLNSLISCFERNERTVTDQLALNFDQSRVLNILAQWVREYPGDLAHPRARKRLTDFVSALERSPFYMFYAKEISASFDLIEEDEDEGWPYGDGDVGESNSSAETFLDHSGRSSPYFFLSGTTAENSDNEEEDPIYNMNSLDLSSDMSPEPPTDLSNSPLSDKEKPATVASQEYTPISLEAARKDAQSLELTARIPLTKMQWRLFMDFPDDDFAKVLTRIDWVMYSSFRPRDLVQHVNVSGQEKHKIRNLKHVNRLIAQFNHVATFVASMILLRDKPKHRARALEKFMNVAQKLRRLNNYNSLGAVIAGIDGVPVHRLSQTRELIPQLTEKNFMQLEILMKSEKSHGPYRLAWDNTNTPRIPFLPLHRRDLVAVEEGNRTFVGTNKDRINWRKFEVLGDVVVLLQLSQQNPYQHLHRFPDVERLIQEIKLPADQTELYERSMHVEPPAGGERKKFGFLRT